VPPFAHLLPLMAPVPPAWVNTYGLTVTFSLHPQSLTTVQLMLAKHNVALGDILSPEWPLAKARRAAPRRLPDRRGRPVRKRVGCARVCLRSAAIRASEASTVLSLHCKRAAVMHSARPCTAHACQHGLRRAARHEQGRARSAAGA